MDMREYQELARRTQNFELSNRERMLHALHGLSAETGEIHSIFQKIYQGHSFDVDVVADEIGDLEWFVSELCDCLGLDMEEVCKRNIEKLKKRYPQGFDAERSVHRDE